MRSKNRLYQTRTSQQNIRRKLGTIAAHSYFGESVRRVEDPKYIGGKGNYVDDMKLPDMLHAAMLRSPHSHAKIKRINTERALKIKGVRAVVTAKEVEKFLGFNPVLLQYWKVNGLNLPKFYACAKDRVRFVGEIVAAVVADDRYIANDALESIEVEYEPLNAVVDAEEALRPESKKLHDEFPTNVSFTQSLNLGEVESAFKNADLVVKEKLRINRINAAPMECRGLLSSFEPSDGSLTIWVSHQTANIYRTNLSRILHIPENKIRVILPDVGGGFGAKLQTIQDDLLTIIMSMMLGKPVKWIASRQEDLMSSCEREQVHYAEMAFKKDGTILGMKDKIIADLGAYAHSHTVGPSICTGFYLPGLYRFKNISYELVGAYTNKVPNDSYRGYGLPQACFVYESLIDSAAGKLGMNANEIRSKNFIKPAEFPFTVATGLVYDSGNYQQSLEKAIEAINYESFKKEQSDARKAGRYLGLGIACYVELGGLGPSGLTAALQDLPGYECSTVRMDSSGKATVITGSSSHGQGLQTTLAQICADQLGVRFEDVKVVQNDTALIPYGVGTYASRSAVMGGTSVMKASQKVREKATKIAAHLLEAAPADIQLEDGKFFVKGTPSRTLTYEQVARAAYLGHSLPTNTDPGLEATQFFDPPGLTWSNGVNAVKVEVDPETGRVKILSYVVIHDCGNMINPMIVEGQVCGGTTQGLGAAMLEEILYDKAGTPLNPSFVDYMIPTAGDVPTYEVFHLRTPSPYNPYGLKGMGEGGTVPPPAALALAVTDALSGYGVRVTETPITPEKVFQLVHSTSRK
jgi:aerobic carbon-monoxide dehydrogenase large subunit